MLLDATGVNMRLVPDRRPSAEPPAISLTNSKLGAQARKESHSVSPYDYRLVLGGVYLLLRRLFQLIHADFT